MTKRKTGAKRVIGANMLNLGIILQISLFSTLLKISVILLARNPTFNLAQEKCNHSV